MSRRMASEAAAALSERAGNSTARAAMDGRETDK